MTTKGVYRVIYGIKNIINGKMYVGSANRYRERRRQHINCLNKGNHANSHLQRSWVKYGESAFVFGVIEELLPEDSLAVKEQYWMDYFQVVKTGYNIHPNARTALGHRFSDEVKANMSKSKKGKPWSATARIAMMTIDRKLNHSRIGKTGSKHSQSKPIVRTNIKTGEIDIWESINQCAVKTGIHKPNIILNLQGKIKQIKGYRFHWYNTTKNS